jgi:hypothetical protein
MVQPDFPALKPAAFGAQRLGINVYRFYELVRDGVITPPVVVRLGRRISVNAEALEDFIRSGGSGLPGGGWKRTDG